MAADLRPETPRPVPSLSAPGPSGSRVLLRPCTSCLPPCSLTLEWNSLGTWEDAFATFCRALAGNGVLRQLDLRNNQISHQGAEELALALKSNTSLQQLGEPPGQPPWPGTLLPQPSQYFLRPVPKAGAGVGRRGELRQAPALLVMPQMKHPG